MGRERCAPVQPGGELLWLAFNDWSGDHGEVLRGSRGDAAGTESGSSTIERITVNTGTVPVLPRAAHPARLVGLGASTVDRSGTGRSRRSTPSRGKPAHMGKGGSGIEKGRRLQCRKTRRRMAALVTGPAGSGSRVAEMQTKLHRWAAADPGRRFDDLFNFVHDPATLIVAFSRVAGNRGANTPGIDGVTAAEIEEAMGVPGFLDDLRVQLKAGTFTPLPVRERTIPKPGG